MTQSRGLSKIHERVFEDRLRYTEQLVAMGASINVEKYAPNRYGTRAEIEGPTRLTGTHVRALDIRAGAGMVHQNVFEKVGYVKGEMQGFAFGMALERMAMLKHKIDDIRLFNGGDLRFLKQF